MVYVNSLQHVQVFMDHLGYRFAFFFPFFFLQKRADRFKSFFGEFAELLIHVFRCAVIRDFAEE